MSRFASKELTAVSDGPDTIYIHAQATMGMERRINKRFLQMKGEVGGKPTLSIDPTEYNFATLCEFIVRWEGPGFEGRPFSEAALAEIGSDDPLIQKVFKEIQERNPRFADTDEDKEDTDPNPVAPALGDGSGSSVEARESHRENGTGTSSSRKGITGTRKR